MTILEVIGCFAGFLFVINVLFVLCCLCMARNDRRREVMRDDVSGLHVFDDDDF